MTNTPDKSELKADELESCPFCGAAVDMPPYRRPYIRHPANGCYFANHNIRAEQWNTRSRPPADRVPNMVERVFAAIQREAAPGNKNFSEREIKSGVSAALQAVPAASEVGEMRVPVELLSDLFDFLGGVDDAADLRERLLVELEKVR